jgi:hypothetical protein
MAENETGAVQLYTTSSLTKREQNDFARAGRTIALGLKSFLEAAMDH